MSVKHEDEVALVASELRVVLGQLVRRLRAEKGLPVSHTVVLGRLDREGPQSVSDLAVSERMRPQSMAQTVAEMEADGLVQRAPDPNDRRRAIVSLTDQGRVKLEEGRRRGAGWMARVFEELDAEEQALLSDAVKILRRIVES